MIALAILCGVLTIVACAALGGWAWTLVRLNASFLPYAQGLQALFKLNDMEDEKIRKVLANFEKRAEQTKENPGSRAGGLDTEVAEITRRAQSMGFVVRPNGEVQEGKPVGPIPDAPPEIDFIE